MTPYQVYFVDPEGKLLRTLEIECVGDQAAVEKAIELRDVHEVEVWNRERFIRWIPRR
jgi:hypothetical protein